MSRLTRVAAMAMAMAVLASAPAVADDKPAPIPEQSIGGSAGLATGSHLTPGGLRVAGHYTYQLTEHEWFDGIAAVTYGGGDAACFTDRQGSFVCDHGMLDGKGLEVVVAVRHYFPVQGAFQPFARAGVGAGIARFGGADDVTGGTLVGHAGGGMRTQVSDGIAIAAEADFALGVGLFGHAVGAGSQLGLAVLAGVEFAL